MSPDFSEYPQHLAQLQTAALEAVDPARAVRAYLKPEDWQTAARVWVVGMGKAGVAMAQAACALVGEKLAGGVMAVPNPAPALGPLHFIVGGHPTPTAGSLAAGEAIAALLTQTAPNDVVIALISGGGSALAELPQAGVSLADLQQTNQLLLKSGAPIQAVNCVRQHLSQLKGGGLLRLAQPARVLALILSDVVGNPLPIIASGPTVPTPPAPATALAILDRYHLRPQLPNSVLSVLTHPNLQSNGLAQSPVSNLAFENRLIASNRQAAEAALTTAKALGFAPVFAGDDWEGEAREAGGRFAQQLLDERETHERAVCVVAGGETTVTVRGQGRGGRNQEAALGAALALADSVEAVVATLATDGVDGPTDAAGAVATGETLIRAFELGLDPVQHLADNDAYPFFAALGALVLTGPTGTNVNDLWIGLAY